MTKENETLKPADNMELLKQEASACGSDCSCHAPGNSGRMRWLAGAVILLVAGALVARAVIKNDKNQPQKSEVAAFAAPTLAVVEKVDGAPAAPVKIAKPETNSIVGKELAAFDDLNAFAATTNVLFVFLPAKPGTSGTTPTAQMENAAKTLEAQKNKVGLFTLKTDSADYGLIVEKMTVPGVVVLVKGGGMIAVSGEITETKLIQGFVAASRSGGCGPSGCGPSGCQ